MLQFLLVLLVAIHTRGQEQCQGQVCLPTQYCSFDICLNDQCDSDANCGDFGHCFMNATSSICLPNACLSSVYCPPGFFCDTLSNATPTCKPFNPTCSEANPCPAPLYCSFVTCLPRNCNNTSPDCTRYSNASTCSQGACLPISCLTDAYCPNLNFFCNQTDHQCHLFPSAIDCAPPDNQPCPSDYYCTEAFGCLGLHCNTTNDCLGHVAVGSFCDQGVCLPPSCTPGLALSCPPGFACNASFRCAKLPPTAAPTVSPTKAPTKAPTPAPTPPTPPPTFAQCTIQLPCLAPNTYCSNGVCLPLQCQNNSQCIAGNENAVCLNGVCLPVSCLNQTQNPFCPPGFICSSAGVCVVTAAPSNAPTTSPTAAPTFVSGCSSNVSCQPANQFYCSGGVCLPLHCNNSAQCQAGNAPQAHCAVPPGVCLPGSCLSNADCPSGFACDTTTRTCFQTVSQDNTWWLLFLISYGILLLIIIAILLWLLYYYNTRRTRLY